MFLISHFSITKIINKSTKQHTQVSDGHNLLFYERLPIFFLRTLTKNKLNIMGNSNMKHEYELIQCHRHGSHSGFSCTPSLFTGRAAQEIEKSLNKPKHCSATEHQSVIHITLILNPKHTTIPATRKEITSIPAKTRTVLIYSPDSPL